MRFTVPFRLLEINVLSAQDLAPSSRSIQTYAIAWIHPDRKLTTRVDTTGRSNPVWNEKFVFRVDDEFLQSNTSAITVEIYKVGWLKKDTRIGTVNAFMANLLPPTAIGEENKPFDTSYVALQVRRSSKRPQGILNLGVSLLDNTFHSMPLNTDNLDSSKQDQLGSSKRSAHDDSKLVNKLRRTNSDMTDRTTDPQRKVASVVNTGASIVNGSIPTGSVLNGGGSMVNGAGGNGSMCTDVGPSASVVAAAIAKGIYPLGPTKNSKSEGERLIIWDGDEKEHGVEGLKTKMDRWRTEMPGLQDYPVAESAAKKRAERRLRQKGGSNHQGSLWSCFGTAYRIEFSVSCGGPKPKKRTGNINASEITYTESFI